MKQKELAAALKCIVIVCLLAGIGLCGILLPDVWRDHCQSGCGICVAVLALPCGIVGALRAGTDRAGVGVADGRAYRRGQQLCVENAQALKWICALAVLDTGLCLVGGLALAVILRGLPPFLLLLCAAVMLVGTAIAVVSAVLSHLIQKAADLKADQDLTI